MHARKGVSMDLQTMALEKLLEEINGFTALSRQRDLTEEESQRRQAVRKEYLRRIGNNLRRTIEDSNIEYRRK